MWLLRHPRYDNFTNKGKRQKYFQIRFTVYSLPSCGLSLIRCLCFQPFLKSTQSSTRIQIQHLGLCFLLLVDPLNAQGRRRAVEIRIVKIGLHLLNYFNYVNQFTICGALIVTP